MRLSAAPDEATERRSSSRIAGDVGDAAAAVVAPSEEAECRVPCCWSRALCGSKLWNYPDGAPKHSHACSKEERGGSLRARSGAPDYTYKPDSEAEPRSRYAATAHLEMTAPNPSRCLHLALAQLLSSRDRLAGLAPVFMSPMPACASERASNRHNHRHT